MSASLALAQGHTSSKFSGAKVNAGTVTHTVKDGKNVLTLSSDFQVPDTPDPHWQIVDSKGNTYLLQIYCAWAEAVLGEASFAAPMMTMNR
ncbi:MAG: hypothetical protein DMF93_10740 [Acidobacteria bacterium]|nr:MAG: hypothetical protein DMF93_10740 [Acidobacteriota bacterium]